MNNMIKNDRIYKLPMLFSFYYRITWQKLYPWFYEIFGENRTGMKKKRRDKGSKCGCTCQTTIIIMTIMIIIIIIIIIIHFHIVVIWELRFKYYNKFY
jgi:hypothetical protein